MKRYDIFAAVANGRPEIDVCEDPEGGWVKWDDVRLLLERLDAQEKQINANDYKWP